MTRLAVALVCALVLVTPALAAAPRPPARLQVVADEFGLTLSRGSVRGGPVIVELVNFGEDDHDLALRRNGGTRTYRIAVVRPGATSGLETRLRPGRYALWCTLADHRARGMRATLRVTRSG